MAKKRDKKVYITDKAVVHLQLKKSDTEGSISVKNGGVSHFHVETAADEKMEK